MALSSLHSRAPPVGDRGRSRVDVSLQVPHVPALKAELGARGRGLHRVTVVRPPFTGIAHAVVMSDSTLDRRSFLRYGAIVTGAAGGGPPSLCA